MEHLVIGDKLDKPDKTNLLDLLMVDKDNQCELPKIELPKMDDKLWVMKAIAGYEPDNYNDLEESKKYNFKPDIKGIDKPGMDKPKSHTEIRDCEMELNGYDLQKIIVEPKEGIDFGEIFKNSEQTQTFWVKNNLRTCIFVALEIDLMELKRR
jgi:hypothetical protein